MLHFINIHSHKHNHTIVKIFLDAIFVIGKYGIFGQIPPSIFFKVN